MLDLGQRTRIYLTLMACVIVACLPSGALHVNLCDCNGIILESFADACPCTHPAPASCSDSPVSVEACGNGCCTTRCHDAEKSREPEGNRDPDPDPADSSCCDELSLGFACLLRDASPEPPNDRDVGAALPPGPPRVVVAGELRPVVSRATGPPGWPRARRAFLERACTVLLI